MNSALNAAAPIFGIAFLFIGALFASAISWRLPFLLHGVVAIVFMPVAISLDHVALIAPETRAVKQNLAELRHAVVPFGLIFVLFIVALLVNSQLAFLMNSAGLSSPVELSLVFGVETAAVLVASVLFPVLIRRLKDCWCVEIAFWLMMLSLLVALAARSIGMFCITSALGGGSIGLARPALWTWAMRVVAENVLPRALGLLIAFCYLGGVVGPFVLAPIGEIFGLRGEYLICASVVAFGVTLAMAVRWLNRKRLGVPLA